MIPIDFAGTNLTLRKPDGMTDEQCMEISAYRGTDSDGYSFILTAWQPNFDDVKAINEGRPIFLKILGKSFQPAAVFTTDEDFNVNNL